MAEDDTTLADRTVVAGGEFTVTEIGLDGERGRAASDSGRYTEHFSLRGSVGAGGVGRVLLGYDERIGREVAIKEILDSGAADSEFRARFVREAQVTGRLEHPGIVPVYEMGTTPDGMPFYAMRLIRGRTLGAAIAACKADTPEAALARRLHLLGSLTAICEAMAYAHSKGVIHRDLKPGNVILGDFGETIILDWGLAKLDADRPDDAGRNIPEAPATGGGDAELTRQGSILGTPAYMAPEQADPRLGPVDRRTDVFALGCILHQILVGHPPFRGEVSTILERLAGREPTPSPREAGLALPPELVAICEKALAKDKDGRFPDAAALAEELRAFRDGRLVSAYAYSRGELLRRFVSRNKAAVLSGLAVVVAIVVGAGLALNFAIEAHDARQLAEAERIEALEAKERAQSALVNITAIGNENLQLAGEAGRLIAANVDALAERLRQAARRLAGRDLTDPAASAETLEELAAARSDVVSFVVVTPPGTISATYPPQYAGVIGSDISDQAHIRWIFENQRAGSSRLFRAVEGFHAVVLQVPIIDGERMTGVLSAVLRAHDFIRSALPPEILAHHLWVMEDDGVILFDRNPEEIGRNLLSDARYDAFPELRRLGERMRRENEGLGYYTYRGDGAGMVHKVASWRTVDVEGTTDWKVIVVRPYIEDVGR